jgi:predicted ester cyclase
MPPQFHPAPGSTSLVRTAHDRLDRWMMGATRMSEIAKTARAFFEACETGKGWEGCKDYCVPSATFSCQADPLAKVTTLAGYCDWMTGLFKPMPDAGYTLKSFAVDEAGRSVTAFAVFTATHSGEGGPLAPTGKSTSSDYVYVMDFDGDRIAHMTKIWNAGWALRELGWG